MNHCLQDVILKINKHKSDGIGYYKMMKKIRKTKQRPCTLNEIGYNAKKMEKKETKILRNSSKTDHMLAKKLNEVDSVRLVFGQ